MSVVLTPLRFLVGSLHTENRNEEKLRHVSGRQNNNKKDKTDNMKTSSASFSQSKRNTRQEHSTSSSQDEKFRPSTNTKPIHPGPCSKCCMEKRGDRSLSAQPKASRSSKRCPLTVSSVLAKTGRRISRMEGPVAKLRFGPDDPEEPEEAVDPDITYERSISAIVPGGLRFGSDDLTAGAIPDEDVALIDGSEVNIIPKVKVANTTGGLRFASEDSPANTYHKDSVESDILDIDDSPGCCNRTQGRTVSRNTMGYNSYMKSVARCSEDATCSQECGYGTGCEAQCRDLHGIAPDSLASSLTVPSLSLTGPGGQPAYPGAYSGLPARPGSVGYADRQGGYPDPNDGRYRPQMECPDSCPGPRDNGGQLNFYIMLLLEIFGVLIFFAICTITFWITLAYHFIKLLVELKNADRNTQVAVAIVFGLLFLAFVICHVTSGSGSGSCGRSSDRSRHSWNKGSSCGRYKAKPKPKTSIITKVLSQVKNVLSFGSGWFRSSPAQSCSGSSQGKGCSSSSKGKACSSSSQPKDTPCGAKKEATKCRQKQKYSDCEGRAIFINSRRYAIPTEMKQPPTILVWLLDVVSRYM